MTNSVRSFSLSKPDPSFQFWVAALSADFAATHTGRGAMVSANYLPNRRMGCRFAYESYLLFSKGGLPHWQRGVVLAITYINHGYYFAQNSRQLGADPLQSVHIFEPNKEAPIRLAKRPRTNIHRPEMLPLQNQPRIWAGMIIKGTKEMLIGMDDEEMQRFISAEQITIKNNQRTRTRELQSSRKNKISRSNANRHFQRQ
jgi:hypothetical protein